MASNKKLEKSNTKKLNETQKFDTMGKAYQTQDNRPMQPMIIQRSAARERSKVSIERATVSTRHVKSTNLSKSSSSQTLRKSQNNNGHFISQRAPFDTYTKDYSRKTSEDRGKSTRDGNTHSNSVSSANMYTPNRHNQSTMSMTGLTQEQLTKRRASKGKVFPISKTPEQIRQQTAKKVAAELAAKKAFQPIQKQFQARQKELNSQFNSIYFSGSSQTRQKSLRSKYSSQQSQLQTQKRSLNRLNRDVKSKIDTGLKNIGNRKAL